MQPGLEFSGRVVNPAGEPLPSASIGWETMRYGTTRASWRDETDRTGRFQLHPLPPGHWRFPVECQGYVSQTVEIDLMSSLERDIVLQPMAGVTFTLRLIGPDERPMQGIVTRLEGQDGSDFRSTVRTDASGMAHHHPVPAGRMFFTASVTQQASAYRVVEVGGEDQELTLDLRTWPTVSGRITRAGEPAPGVQLQAWTQRPDNGLVASAYLTTDAAGCYATRVPPGRFQISTESRMASCELTRDAVLDLDLPAN